MVSSINALNDFVIPFFFSLAVMRNPVACNKGHTMCEKCLETAMFKGNGNCPVDRTFLGAVLPVRNLALQEGALCCPFNCGEILRQGGTVRNHFEEYKAPHLNATMATLLQTIKSKVLT